jgi:hypothetical protein
MAYATVAQLRQYLPDVPVDADNEALLTSILERATAIVEAELGFAFAAYDYVAENKDAYSGAGGRWLYLPAHMPESVTAVDLVASRGLDGESTEAVTEYVESDRYRLYLDSGWLPRRWYRVTAVWGYGAVPAEIVEVTLEVAVNIWRGRDAANWSADLGASGGGATPYRRALTWAQRSIIDRVKRQYPPETTY